MGIKLGMEGKIYFDPLGVGGSTWTEMSNAKDVTLNLESGEADVTTRANQGWRATIATLRDASVEFEMVWDTLDAGFAAIKDAYMNKTPIGLAIMDGDITAAGSQGLQANCSIMKFTRAEQLEEAMSVSVTVKPTYSTLAPEWVTVP